jgi:hypothetical protein
MKAQVIRFKDLSDFIKITGKFPNKQWIFRGQRDGKAPLVPKAGRPEYVGKGVDDLDRFKRWSHQAIAFCPELPENDFERLAVARHFGLATRLLDWSLNALVALFFATEYEPKVEKDGTCSDEVGPDGAVFIFRKPDEEIDPLKDALDEPSPVKLYTPRPIVRRIIAQDGVFTFHPTPEEVLQARRLSAKTNHPLAKRNLLVLPVPAKMKRQLQGQLRDVGILARTVYPDIQGLSDSINLVTHWMAHKKKREKATFSANS